MKRFYTLLAAIAFASAAFAQDYNLYNAADIDQDGWLWFDTQAKIDKYVGEADLDYGKFKPLTEGGKLIQLTDAGEAGDYKASFAAPDFVGVGKDGNKGTEGARKGGIAMLKKPNTKTPFGSGLLIYMPSCKRLDLAFACESSMRLRLLGTKKLDNAFESYTVVSAKYATVFGKLSGPGNAVLKDAQTLNSGNSPIFTLDSEEPIVAYIQNSTADTLYLQGVRVYTYAETTLGVSELKAVGNGLTVHNGTAYVGQAANIEVYALDGKRVHAGYGTTLSLATLPKGVYVVKAGRESKKFVLD